jgi:two-component system chemotaxis response regulator CheB
MIVPRLSPETHLRLGTSACFRCLRVSQGARSRMLRVLIVSGAVLFRQGLRNILSESSSVAVVDAVSDLRTALARLNALQPDVVVLDHDGTGDGAIEAILGDKAVGRLIVLSLRDNRLTVYTRAAVPAPSRDQLLAAVLSGAALTAAPGERH